MMKRSFSKSRGFTLLEVLVAFSIFTISLGVLFQIFSKGTRAAILGNEYSQAVIIAQSRLANAGIEGELDNGEYSGEENETYRWTTTIRPYDSSDDLETNFGISRREIEIVVNWNSQGKTHSIKLNTLKLIPTT
jgi:general secretion pathway protein I